jgi:peroxiredoxin
MPQAGEPAPGFALRDQHGREQSLAARHGERNLLLVFYPFAFTGVCTGEMRALSDYSATWDTFGTDVIAVSCDPIPAIREFADAEKLDLPLASDFWPHGAVSTAYDAFDPILGAAVRATFVIDRAGVIRWSVRNEISDPREITDYVKALTEL